MKNRYNICITLVALAFALAPIINAKPGPVKFPPPPAGTEAAESPVITIHSTDNVIRGNIGSFVLDMQPALDTMPALSFGGRYVNFKVSGTAIAGVDYILLVSPTRIGQSGYGVIQVQTLPDQRGSSFRQAYSVVVTLESGAGYAVGASRSATMWIKP
ncbi:MAG TPA: hypothetical protein VGK91_04490 [Candidatus Udaeobacter sp.]|jgi:hypothetical protein